VRETALPTSNSNSLYSALDPRLQRWIFEQNWDDLRDIQQKAIPALLDGDEDVILAAATSTGKTEAAFLPLLSRIARSDAEGIRLLYVSPLRALINDQFGRLESLAGAVDQYVTPWHGDVAQKHKTQIVQEPKGILLITPESLESFLGNHGSAIPKAFGHLEAILIDELHAFLGTERGRQVQSLLTRIEARIDRRVRRIGLSATIGKMELAADFLRPREAEKVIVLISEAASLDLKLSLKAYTDDVSLDSEDTLTASRKIAGRIFEDLRSGHHLVFANSRQKVEYFSSVLGNLAEEKRLPCQFLPHHGSLSKDIREYTEQQLKDPSVSATAICTSTLELGIDIGSVESIAQIGPSPSVASLRQRLGRSGRRDDPAVLRLFIEESDPASSKKLLDALRPGLIRSIAQIQLLFQRWVEAPRVGDLHLSTLVHQILALVCERGSIIAGEVYQILCQDGPFHDVGIEAFKDVLHAMGSKDILTQTHDGELVVGLRGEKIRSHFTFYTVFQTPEEYRLISDKGELGTLPITYAIVPDMTIVFAGRPWRVINIDAERKVIKVEPTAAAELPHFHGSGFMTDDKVAETERTVYLSEDIPAYLDMTAKEMLLSARQIFKDVGLCEKRYAMDGDSLLLLPFKGTRVALTLQLLFIISGLSSFRYDTALVLRTKDIDGEGLQKLAKKLSASKPPRPEELIKKLEPRIIEKYHWILPEPLLDIDVAQRLIDLEGTWEILREVGENKRY
jgi:ATP-dependent Lhr-like helicase